MVNRQDSMKPELSISCSMGYEGQVLKFLMANVKCYSKKSADYLKELGHTTSRFIRIIHTIYISVRTPQGDFSSFGQILQCNELEHFIEDLMDILYIAIHVPSIISSGLYHCEVLAS